MKATDKKAVFTPDEFDLHGFHDDRHVLVVELAARICAGLVANPSIVKAPEDINGDRRQVLADAALDMALRICSRVETKKSQVPTGLAR